MKTFSPITLSLIVALLLVCVTTTATAQIDAPRASIEIKGEQESTLLERDIDRCLGKLQELPREIVSLLGRGFSYKEIGEMTGTTRENVRVILCRARKQLHDCLEGEKT